MIEFFGLTNPALPDKIGKLTSDTAPAAFGGIVSAIIGFMYIIGFLTALIYLITGGFYWITSAGDKNNLESARNRITQAILGLIVIFSTYAVMSLLANFVGWTDFPTIPFPTMGEPSKSAPAQQNNSNSYQQLPANQYMEKE